MPLPNQEIHPPEVGLPFVLRGTPKMITAPGSEETESTIPTDHMPEDLSQEMTALPSHLPPPPEPRVSSLPPMPTEDELRDMEDAQAEAVLQAEQDAADRAAEQQDRAQEATENFARKRAQEADNDDLFGLNEEDVLGGTEEDLDSEFSIDDDDEFSVSQEDILGGDADDFSDILEVSQDDVLGKPPMQTPQRKMRRVRGVSPPVNPQLGGMAY